MHISLEWLNEFLDLEDLSGNQVSELLTSIGHEVESVTSLEALPETILTGKILSAEPHPQADKLQVCQVDVSAEAPLTIVCGAPNARPGLCVAVATIGTDLGEGFVIKPAKIRGQASEGMLCSEKELGLGDELVHRCRILAQCGLEDFQGAHVAHLAVRGLEDPGHAAFS